MGSRRCCCLGCWTWTDLFQRASLGSEWTVVSGTWAIESSEYLNEAGTAGAMILKTANVSPTPFHHTAGITLKELPAVGAKPRVIVNWIDSSNYHYVEFEVGDAGGNGTIRLVQVSSGTPSILLEDATASVNPVTPTIQACYSANYFVGIVTSGNYWICDPGSTGTKVGIGNGAAIEFDVNSFGIQELWRPSKPECPACLCLCEGECIPMTLTGTIIIEDPDSYCGECHLVEVSFEYDHVGQNWKYDGSPCHDGWEMVFNCDPGEEAWEDRYTIYAWSKVPGGCIQYDQEAGAIEYESSCDPLSLKIGPFHLTDVLPPDNHAWIVLTRP